MKQDRIIQGVCGVVVTAAVLLSGLLSTSLAAEAGRAQLGYAEQTVEGDPPEVAVGVALGAFRGLFVNYLWIRAEQLKQEGKFHEAIELSTAITRLQPRFPRVWAFHAWNMAYNISVATPSAEERWTWVRAGVNLLRDEGVRRNPRSPLLHKELAWIFLHKIQGHSDDANWYYKRELAREWTHVLGVPPRTPDDHDAATEVMIEWLSPVVDAPATLAGVLERERDLVTSDPDWRPGQPFESEVADLVAAIRSEAGLELGPDLLRFVVMARAAGDRVIEQQRGLRVPFNQAVNELLADPRYEAAWELLLPHVRKRVLIDEYNMEPDRMRRYTRDFGPLDWRHPASHAVYWSARGVEEALDVKSTETFDTLNTDRVTIHAVQELYRSGTILFDLYTGEYYTVANYAWIPVYGEIMEEARSRGGLAANRKGYNTFSEGYENFLKDVIRNYWRAGRPDLAEQYRDRLCDYQLLNTNDPWQEDQCRLPLRDFVRSQMRDRLSIPHVVAEEIRGSVYDGFYRGLLAGDVDRFQRNLEYARWIHEQYFIEQPVRTLPDRQRNRMEKIFESFRDTFEVAIGQFMVSIPVEDASDIYGEMSLDLRRLMYTGLTNNLRQRGYPQERIDELFPKPEGQEAFEAMVQRERDELGDSAKKRDIQWVPQ